MDNSTPSLSQVFGNTDNAVMANYTFNREADNTNTEKVHLPRNILSFSRDVKRIHEDRGLTGLLNSCLPLDFCMLSASGTVDPENTPDLS